MPTIDCEGAVIWFETLGSEDAPPVVLLHDAGADLRAWTPVAQRLAADYWLVLIDLRGHGLSDWQATTVETPLSTYLADVDAVMHELGIELCAVAGMGCGALVALRMAIEQPDRVVAVVTGGHLDGVVNEGDAWTAARDAVSATMGTYGAGLYGKRLAASVRDPYLAGGVAAIYQQVQTDGVVSALAAMSHAGLDTSELATLRAPTMVGTGDHGAGSAAGDRIADLLPGVWRVHIREAGDDVAVTHASAFADQMARFFAAVEQGLPIQNRVTV